MGPHFVAKLASSGACRMIKSYSTRLSGDFLFPRFTSMIEIKPPTQPKFHFTSFCTFFFHSSSNELALGDGGYFQDTRHPAEEVAPWS